MKRSTLPLSLPAIIVGVVIVATLSGCCHESAEWQIDTTLEWQSAASKLSGITIEDDLAKSTAPNTTFTSNIRRFESKHKAKSITLKQSDSWDNWQQIARVATPEMVDAPVLITVDDGDYWLLCRRYDTRPGNIEQTRKLYPDSELGYHAWHSSDMKSWKHYGAVSGYVERWVTTAEYCDGRFYIYYDNPNDQDPHLIVDEDLTDGKMGKNYGMVLSDPTNGSDCAIIRDVDGQFNLIYENWDYNNARKQSWDAPVAGRAVSPDGINDFKIMPFAVDERTAPTGTRATFLHPYRPDPGEDYTSMEYEVRQEGQSAFGDWTAIKVGEKYYLFGDYDPYGGKICTGKFVSNSLDEQFTFCGELGSGHPDPTIGFAEGKFWLLQQDKAKVDFISDGPWVGGVEVRVGVDSNNDGLINSWTPWSEVKESYSRRKGFARIVDAAPALCSLESLPAGYGFIFEYRTTATEDQTANVAMSSITLKF